MNLKVIEVSELVKDYGKELYNFCRHLTPSKEEADELYQDTFLKAVEICDRIDFDQNPKSYLFSIAVKLWKNRKRKHAWRGRIATIESHSEASEYGAYFLDNQETPETELLKKEKLEIVNNAVRSLKEEYRVPMYLYYAANLSLKEISRILQRPEGTVKSRLYKARGEVKKYLEDKGYGR